MKKLRITDDDTGEIILEKEFSGGYHLIYTNIDDSGKLHHIRELDNAKFGEKHWIKNFVYRHIAVQLVKKFEELRHIKPSKILFIEDMDYEDPENGKPQWRAKISKANKQFTVMTGYEYILETRNYFIERMQREQIIALIYHELRHIGQDGDMVKHDIEDWNNMIATPGTDWATTQAKIKDLLEDKILWSELEPLVKQIDMFSLQEFNRYMDGKDKKAL